VTFFAVCCCFFFFIQLYWIKLCCFIIFFFGYICQLMSKYSYTHTQYCPQINKICLFKWIFTMKSSYQSRYEMLKECYFYIYLKKLKRCQYILIINPWMLRKWCTLTGMLFESDSPHQEMKLIVETSSAEKVFLNDDTMVLQL